MEIKRILEIYNNSTTQELSKKANEITGEEYSNKVYINGIIDFSNNCEGDCIYCNLMSSNNYIERYRMDVTDILKTISEGYEKGVRSFTLQSGNDNYYNVDKLSKIIEEIKNVTGYDTAITLSCGIKTKDEYKKLKKAGADRYILRFETSDPKLYKKLRNGLSLKDRLKAISYLKDAGFEVGSGYLVGLPEETEETRIKNALLCKKLQLDIVTIGQFTPFPNTPLSNFKQQSFELTLRAIALARLLNPKANISATTTLSSIDNSGREKVVNAGANVLMPNITPTKFKKHYLIFPGKICLDESGFECIDCLENKLKILNKTISLERGDSKSFLNKYSTNVFPFAYKTLSEMESVS